MAHAGVAVTSEPQHDRPVSHVADLPQEPRQAQRHRLVGCHLSLQQQVAGRANLAGQALLPQPFRQLDPAGEVHAPGRGIGAALGHGRQHSTAGTGSPAPASATRTDAFAHPVVTERARWAIDRAWST